MDDSVTLLQREDVKAAMRLCKDCKHCRPDRFFAIIAPFGSKKYQYADCAYLKSPVDGSPWRMCSTMRWIDHLCGPEGRFWEKRR